MFLAIRRFTKLTEGEIDAMSPKVGMDWDNLAALMDIPYSHREEIRINYVKYPDFSSKAKRVFERFSESKSFDRHILVKHFKELRRQDLINEMPPMEDEVIHEFILSSYPIRKDAAGLAYLPSRDFSLMQCILSS